jgi:predicted ATPase
MSIQSIQIFNFKSIRDSQRINIKPLNVLIGANGAGKSNFIGFFKFLNVINGGELQNYITSKGRADGLMYFGRQSEYLGGNITFRNEEDKISNRYRFKMQPDPQSGGLFFSEEWSDYNTYPAHALSINWDEKRINPGGTPDSKLSTDGRTRTTFLRDFFRTFKVFHFHDTSDSSKMKGFSLVSNNETLSEDGRNLAAFLYRMQQTAPRHFKLLEFTVRSIAPFFDSFFLQPNRLESGEDIELRWRQIGHDNLFNAYSLSDGTLRFIALCTLLLQPEPPATIIIDEPELGLHPSAITKLSAMIKSASERSQIIISTQSVNLLDQFSAEDILVVDRVDDQSVFRRLTAAELEDWLSEYTIGALWQKNLIGGRP